MSFFASAVSVHEKLLDGAQIDVFRPGVKLFSDRGYPVLSVPSELDGASFVRTGIADSRVLACTRPGVLYAVTPVNHPQNSLAHELIHRGFEKLDVEPFQLFGTAPNDKAGVYRKEMSVGDIIKTRKWVVLLALDDLQLSAASEQKWSENDGELLYNGIRLPRLWPPLTELATSDAPMDVPYLEYPPEVISMDVGRQLFVDDFLIESTDLNRNFHVAEKYEGNPVFTPETKAESRNSACYLGHGGVFYDFRDQLIKMWYRAGGMGGALAFATSPDAIHWTRPDLGRPAGGNLIFPHRGDHTYGIDSGADNCVWLDTLTTNSAGRIKLMTQRDSKDSHWLKMSPDNQTWSEPVRTGPAQDYCSFFFNPFRKVWGYSIKRYGPHGRCRDYAESPDFLTKGIFNRSVFWCNADRLDEPDPVVQDPPQLYSLNAVAYESLMLGVFYIHLGPSNEICQPEKRPKITELKLGFSRDGFHWSRPDRRAFIAAERKEGVWDRAYLHSTAGICLVDKDRLVFPYCAFSGVSANGKGMYDGAGIGLAMLRRDGFASMDAGVAGGTLTTRPVQFSGKHVFVNLDAPDGSLKMEIQDTAGNPIKPFTFENSIALTADTTIRQMTWRGGSDVSALAGRPVRFLFELENGSLYSFWVSKDKTGRSDGYLAAGGSGYTGVVDTVGENAFSRQ